MTKISYISGWKPELCIELNTDSNHKADFNRFMVKHFPSTKAMQLGGEFEDANREGFILQLKSRYDEVIDEGGSHESLLDVFGIVSLYLRWCDKEGISAFTKSSIEGYLSYLDNRVMLGEIKSSTYKVISSKLFRVFTQSLDLPSAYFDSVVVRNDYDRESFESFTKSDLNQLLPFLRALFKQTHRQFMSEPDKHINAYNHMPTMTFLWKGMTYELCGGISKMMCAGTFLLAYYTYANTGDLLQLKQPENASTTLGETWYTMPAFKRRAFKVIRVEMGEHELEIPKYSLDFFDNLLEASKRISSDENATLLQTIASKKVQPIKRTTLQDFLKRWVERYFLFTDQTGRKLRPVISRFRESGAQLTVYHQGELASDMMLGNTPNVRKKHYSRGNQHNNNGMMQDTFAIREEQVKQGCTTQQAIENLNIDVLVIDQENKINLPNLSRTSNGGSCSDPFGSKSDKYTKRAKNQGLAKEGERLACADLLKCFGCSNQVIIQSVADIWCLLSFKTCIEESLYLHLDAHHFRNNFELVITFIDSKILPKINSKILREAEKKLSNNGLHPAWDESESILNLIPRSN